MEMPTTASVVATVSAMCPRRSAAIVPAASDTSTAMPTAKRPMKMVLGSRWAMSSEMRQPPAMVSE